MRIEINPVITDVDKHGYLVTRSDEQVEVGWKKVGKDYKHCFAVTYKLHEYDKYTWAEELDLGYSEVDFQRMLANARMAMIRALL